MNQHNFEQMGRYSLDSESGGQSQMGIWPFSSSAPASSTSSSGNWDTTTLQSMLQNAAAALNTTLDVVARAYAFESQNQPDDNAAAYGQAVSNLKNNINWYGAVSDASSVPVASTLNKTNQAIKDYWPILALLGGAFVIYVIAQKKQA